MDKTTPMKAKPLVNVTCKLGAKGCFEDGRCHALGRCENKIETNADRIRSMSDEELAEFLSSINTGRDIGYDYFSAKGGIFIESNKNLIKKVQDWLQSERWE